MKLAARIALGTAAAQTMLAIATPGGMFVTN